MDNAVGDETPRHRKIPAGTKKGNDYFFGKNHTKRQLCGAAVVGGAVGFVAMGTVAGIAAAGGAAYAATRRDKVGMVMRSTGDTMADVGSSLKRFDRNHRITEMTANGIIKGNQWISKKLNYREAREEQRRPELQPKK
jgi:hypothetical protein